MHVTNKPTKFITIYHYAVCKGVPLMKWTEEYRVNVHDTDLNGIVSASGILRYMQDTSNLHMAGEGPSYEALFAEGNSFILSRISLSIYAPLHAHDVIKSQTWAVASRGVTYNRCFRIIRGEDIIAEATSVWALVDIHSHRIRRVGEIPVHYSEDDPLELDLPARFRIPAEAKLSLMGERTVLYADVDRNGHMNNTHYPDIFCSYLPEMKHSRVISCMFSFVKEAPLGEMVKMYCGEYDGAYYVRSVLPDGSVNAEAEILLERI